jgi:rSAM/selenodomain-associated transferase 1
MVERLILFAKRPRLGEVKTRLVPPLAPAEVLALYEAVLEDQLRFVRSLATADRAVELCTDEPWVPDGALALASAGLPRSEQGPGDLGARMMRAFTRSYREGAARTVIVGADCPTLPAARVEEAFDRLAAGARAVVSPAEDGGYVLIGLLQPIPELFAEVPWGGAGVLRATRLGARRASVDLVELDVWYDVDDPSDLARLHRDLRRGARTRAPVTARCLEGLRATLDKWEALDGET